MITLISLCIILMMMRENIDNQINMKKDLLNELRNRRLNNTQLQDSNLTKFNDEVLKIN